MDDSSASPKSHQSSSLGKDDIRNDPAYEAFYANYQGDEPLPPPVRSEK